MAKTTPSNKQTPKGYRYSGHDPYTLQYDSALTAGTTLVAVFTHRTSGDRTVSSVSDNVNGAWTLAVSAASTGTYENNEKAFIYYFPNNQATSAVTVSVDWSGTAEGCMTIYELENVNTSDPLDQTGSKDDASTAVTSSFCAAIAIDTATNVYIVAGAVWYGTVTLSNYSPPFTADFIDVNDRYSFMMSYASDTAVTGEDGSFTKNNVAAGVGVIASFNGKDDTPAAKRRTSAGIVG